jgi:hypothetical protein
MTLDWIACNVCEDDGFVWIPCVRYSTAHWRRKGESEFSIVKHRERFRYPCECARGSAWIEDQRRGKDPD